MKKLNWLSTFWLLLFTAFVFSAFHLYQASPFDVHGKRIWHIESLGDHNAETLEGYSVTIDPAGYFVLVCPEKISSAPWSWKEGKLTFHTRSEDPVLHTLGRSWKVMKNNGRLHLRSMDNSVEAVLTPTRLAES